MTNSLSVRNPEPLKTANKQGLSVEVETEGASQLFLVVPLGDGAEALMTAAEFAKARFSVAKADGAGKDPAEAEMGSHEPDSTKTRGIIEVTQNTRRQEKFCILIDGFTTNNAPGSVEVRLEDNNEEVLAKTTVKVEVVKPQIVSFVSNIYSALVDTTATLSWEIKPPGGHKLTPEPVKDIKDIDSQHAEVKTGARYRLDAMVGDQVTDSRFLTLHSYDQTQVKTYPGPGDDTAEILGVYNRLGRLYAVVRGSGTGEGASIWRTSVGFDRGSWERLLTKPGGAPIRIPADAAARPGAVFDDKLYFMGGSSYDANLPDRDVGYFHFEANIWVDAHSRSDEAWPEAMPARMGHALLASPDGRLWVIGGYNGDGGAMNDIWVYNKDAGQAADRWKKYQGPWEPRCLFGATFHGRELWIAGGFDNPGGYPTYDDIWHLDTRAETNTWQKNRYPLRSTRSEESRVQQFRGCALAALGDQIYAFAAYHNVDKGDGYEIGDSNNVIKISFSSSEWRTTPLTGISSDWVTPQDLASVDCYRFDATVFRGCIFIRRLARSRTKDKQIHYLVCV
jgi:hypothetical protein